MPNITGSFNATLLHDGGAVGYGAFIAGGSDTKSTPQSGGDASQSGFSFDASRSNSIYGNSETITPESLSTKFFIKF